LYTTGSELAEWATSIKNPTKTEGLKCAAGIDLGTDSELIGDVHSGLCEELEETEVSRARGVIWGAREGEGLRYPGKEEWIGKTVDTDKGAIIKTRLVGLLRGGEWSEVVWASKVGWTSM
jgi:hypothetical protein